MYAPQDFYFWNGRNENKAHTLIHKRAIFFIIMDTLICICNIGHTNQVCKVSANAQPVIKI